MKNIPLSIKITILLVILTVFGLMFIFFSNSLLNKRFQKEYSNFQASAYLIQDIKVYEKDSLPKIVMDYLPKVLNNKFNTQRVAEMTYNTESIDPEGRSRQVEGKSYYAIYQPGFISNEEETPFPLTWSKYRDFYITGSGSVIEKFMSISTKINLRGAEIDQDGFVKYICAAPYFPWIFFNKEIFTYISEDSSSLNTIATDKGLKINVSFIFADSKITQLIAEYNQINDPGVKNKVTVNYGNYKDVNGNKVPDGYEIIWDKNGIINKKKVSIIEYKFY